MENAFAYAAFWLLLAVLSTVIAYHLRVSMALVEIIVGAIAAAIIVKFFGEAFVGTDQEWFKFVAATGAVLLTFLAGAELDPATMKLKLKEIFAVGLVGFFAPFIGCTLIARFLLGWEVGPSLLAGIALSTTSMAVVYAVMLEFGFNRTAFGKGILGACFVNDLGTVLALGIIFAPFTAKTIVFVCACAVAFVTMPFITEKLTKLYGNKTAAIRTKWILFVLFALGALALWSGSEAVLPAYIAGMVLAGTISRDHFFIRRLRTLTIGFLTPFYFLRAGSLVSISAIVAAPLVILALFGGKVLSKIFGLFPAVAVFRKDKRERWYYTLLMSTGLTFGTISAMYGYSNGIISREQYTYLVTVVIASAVIPTLIANFAFLPHHLIPSAPMAAEEIPQLDTQTKHFADFGINGVNNGENGESQNGSANNGGKY